MNQKSHEMRSDCTETTIGEAADFTSKPRGLDCKIYERIPFVPMELVRQENTYIHDFVWKAGIDIKSGNYFEKGDCLLAKITPCFENGKQGIARDLPMDFGYASTELIPFRGRHGLSNKYFLFYFFLEATTRRRIAQKMEGATGRQRIPMSVIKSWPISLPPLPEQKKIAAVLLKLQRAIETQEKIIQSLRDLKKSTMKHLFTHGLRGEKTKMTEIGEIPENWEVVSIGTLAEKVTKGSSPRWQGFSYKDAGVLFLRSQNVGWGRLLMDEVTYVDPSFNTKETRSIIKKGDVLINLVGASIGRVAVADQRLEGANANQAVSITRLATHDMYPRFIMYFFLTDIGQAEISYNKKEIARANISLTDIKNFRIPKPNKDEQEHIINMLDRLTDAETLYGLKKVTLQDIFKTTLNKLMTGTIRVADLDVDVNEVE